MTDPIERLRSLGLRLSHDALRARVAEAEKARLSPLDLLARLADDEEKERADRNLARRTKLATPCSFATLDRFDWQHPKSLYRGLYDQLLSLDFIGPPARPQRPSGVGKTTLAQNLALRALEKGLSVRFCTLADLLRQESVPALERRISYTLPHLLVLDELDYRPSDARSADLLYNLVSRRHEQRSIVVTTNLTFKQWPTVFPGAACVAALVDRFAQHCHVLDIDAESWRQKTSLRHAPKSLGRGYALRGADRDRQKRSDLDGR